MADSINLDPHKLLNIPCGTGCLLVRDGSILKHAMALRNEESSYGDIDDDSPIDYTFELSRPARAIPMWFTFRLLGLKTIRTFLQEKIDLAVQLHKKLSNMNEFTVRPKEAPELPILLFRYNDGENSDERTLKLLSKINSDGRVFIQHVPSDGHVWVRVAIAGYRTHASHTILLMELIKKNM